MPITKNFNTHTVTGSHSGDVPVSTDSINKSIPSYSHQGRTKYNENKSANAGWQDFADATTDSSPLTVTDASGGEIQLTCDNGGTLTDGNTNFNANTTMEGVIDMWNTTSNTIQFKGTGLQANQNVFARVHVKVSPNIVPADFRIRLDFYSEENAGGVKVFSLEKHLEEVTSSAGVFEEYIEEFRFFLGESIINGSATINLLGTKAFQVKVVGFNFLIISNNLN